MNKVLEINFKDIERDNGLQNEIIIMGFPKDNWFEIMGNGLLLVGMTGKMDWIDCEELFG